MRFIQRALNELYLASENAEERDSRVETAIEILEEGLEEMNPGMASDELIDMVKDLAAGNELEPIIYELEVINNEL